MQIRTLSLAALVVAGALLSSCGSSTTPDDGPTGSLALTLDLANGESVDQVEYVITRGGMEPMSGLIDTSAPGATASVEVFGLEPGTGYRITMTARSNSEETLCTGDTDFSVEAGVSTEVMVVLQCKSAPSLGGVRANGKINICAELVKMIASPLETSVGNAVELSAVGSDAEDDPFTIRWTAMGGSLQTDTGETNVFTCDAEDQGSVTAEVSDDEFEYCVSGWTIPVNCVSGGGTDIDDVVFFGDSLSDTGNIWYLTQGTPPPPYFQGTSGEAPDFTGGQWSSPEGPSWPTPFASKFGLTATPSFVAGNNYAWGGARTGENPEGIPPWLDQQVATYVGSDTSPGPRTLAAIMIGGNDVANNLGDAEALEAGIMSIVSQITGLYDLGIRQFVVATVPDVGATPVFQELDEADPGTAEFATFWTMQWNAALKTALDELSMVLPDASIGLLDLFALGKDPDLQALFENTTDPCFVRPAPPAEPSICSDPASYFYWDSFHPSSTAHAIIAEAAYEAAVNGSDQSLRN